MSVCPIIEGYGGLKPKRGINGHIDGVVDTLIGINGHIKKSGV